MRSVGGVIEDDKGLAVVGRLGRRRGDGRTSGTWVRRRSAPNGLSPVHPRPWLIDTPRDVCTHIAYIASTISRVIHHQFQICAINVSAKVKSSIHSSVHSVSHEKVGTGHWFISVHRANIMNNQSLIIDHLLPSYFCYTGLYEGVDRNEPREPSW